MSPSEHDPGDQLRSNVSRAVCQTEPTVTDNIPANETDEPLGEDAQAGTQGRKAKDYHGISLACKTASRHSPTRPSRCASVGVSEGARTDLCVVITRTSCWIETLRARDIEPTDRTRLS